MSCPGSPHRSRPARAVAAIAMLLALMPLPAHAGSEDDAARRAAQEIQDARDRANRAADAMFEEGVKKIKNYLFKL